MSSDERERLVLDYAASGLTQRAFARREGLNYHTFVSWCAKERQGQLARGEDTGVAGAAMAFHQVELPGIPGASGVEDRFEIMMPQGVSVRCRHSRQVVELLRMLRG